MIKFDKNFVRHPKEILDKKRDTNFNRVLQELCEVLCVYDMNPKATGREDLIITTIRKILEREVKKEDIYDPKTCQT